MGKEKTSERRTARILYVEQLKTAKEIADLVGVTENTVGGWITKGNWKIERDTKVNSVKKQKEQINHVISAIAERRIQIERELAECDPENPTDAKRIAELRSEAINKADEAAKWNKTLSNLDKANSTSLETYLLVMDEIFSDLRESLPKIYLQLLDFQEKHIQKTALKYQ